VFTPKWYAGKNRLAADGGIMAKVGLWVKGDYAFSRSFCIV
jgi:hypothetical protein